MTDAIAFLRDAVPIVLSLAALAIVFYSFIDSREIVRDDQLEEE